MRTDIPTEYNPGKYTETDHVFNLDLSRSLQTAMLPFSPEPRPRPGVSRGAIRGHGRREEFLVH